MNSPDTSATDIRRTLRDCSVAYNHAGICLTNLLKTLRFYHCTMAEQVETQIDMLVYQRGWFDGIHGWLTAKEAAEEESAVIEQGG